MNLSYQELNKKIVDDALNSEKRFVCEGCASERSNLNLSEDLLVSSNLVLQWMKGTCSICGDMTKVADSRNFFEEN